MLRTSPTYAIMQNAPLSQFRTAAFTGTAKQAGLLRFATATLHRPAPESEVDPNG